jgi:hypothetical protein
MSDKKPVDVKRERGGRVDIGSKDDGGIMEMYNMGGRMLVIKERAIYELRLADDIDPERAYPNLPKSTQKLILPLGTESEIFSRTFLTARRLIKAEYFTITIDVNHALALALEVIQELAAMDEEITDYLNAEKKAGDDYEERKSKNLDHAVPSITDIKTRCKTIFQKADHVSQAQMEIIRLFFPDFDKQSYYSKFLEFIEKRFGKKDPFAEFVQDVLPFIELTRNIRNCLDHRRAEIQINDFDLMLNLDILKPTIQIEYLNSKLERTSLSQFLSISKENFAQIFENMIAHLCSKVLKQNRIMPGIILMIPEDKRINKFIKFAYWAPIGEGGYFQQ